jgi:hypothetical protein
MAASEQHPNSRPSDRTAVPGASPQWTGGTFREFMTHVEREPVYVILGVQGSGTNLLGRLLKRLFNFSVLRDRSLVFNAAVRMGPTPSASDIAREIDAFRGVLAASTLRRKTQKDVIRDNAPFQGLFDELRPDTVRSGADFARTIYAYRAYSLGTTRMAIKSDDLWEHIALIDQVIPNRRIIMLTRDFRDNLLSISGKLFGPVEPVMAARYVKNQLQHYAAEYRRSGPRAYHATFEGMLNATRDFADEFAAHFGIAPTVDLEAEIPALRFRPNKIGKWKRLSAQDLAWCEGILQSELIEFGYEPVSATPSLPSARQFMVARGRDVVRRLPQKIQRMVERAKS